MNDESKDKLDSGDGSSSEQKLDDSALNELTGKIDKLDQKIDHQLKTRNPLLIALFTSIFTMLATLTVTFFSSQLTIKSQLQISTLQNKKEVFGQLLGRKFTRTQLYVSYAEAIFNFDYHQAKWKLAGTPEGSLDFQEAQRYQRKYEDFIVKITENNNALYETLGSIWITFDQTPELDSLVNRIYQLKSPEVPQGQTEGKNTKELDSWRINAIRASKKTVDQEYGKPIEELIAYLREELRRQ